MHEDWIRAYIFALYIQGFHSMCLAMMPAIYLYEESGVGYKAFYEAFLAWSRAHPQSFCGTLYSECVVFVRADVYV